MVFDKNQQNGQFVANIVYSSNGLFTHKKIQPVIDIQTDFILY